MFFRVALLMAVVFGVLWGEVGLARPATGDVVVENDRREVEILITEISFKDKDADWVELFVVDDGRDGGGANLKGYGFYDDRLFKVIENSFWVKTGDYFLLKFNDEESDDHSPFIYSGKKGLVGTTEQLIFYDSQGGIVDGFCWVNDRVAKNEFEDHEQFFDSGGWLGEGVESCFESAGVSRNQSVGRVGLVDSDSRDEWKVMSVSSPGEDNRFGEIDDGDEENVSGGNGESRKEDGNRKKSGGEGDKKSVVGRSGDGRGGGKNVGDVMMKRGDGFKGVVDANAEKIKISKIMPNPSGRDSGNELIELVNFSEVDIRLDGWWLDDGDGGSKPFSLAGKEILSGGVIVIRSDESRLSLANNGDLVRILRPDGGVNDLVEYEGAVEGKAFVRGEVFRDGERVVNWQWSDEVKFGERNPEMEVIVGEVVGYEDYQIWIDVNSKVELVRFDEEDVGLGLARVVFLVGNVVEIVGERGDGEFKMVSYRVLEQRKNALREGKAFDAWLIEVLLVALFVAGGVGWVFYKKKF